MVSEQLTRDRILEAASSLFAEKSFQEVGIREIAKRAGCSHTTIYLYFKNKDEILFEVASAPLENLYQTTLEIYQSNESVEDRLLGVCHHFIRFGFQYASFNQLLFIVEGEEVDLPEFTKPINQLRMKRFDFIDTGIHEEVGLIAQEVEKILPTVVSRNPENEDDYLHIDYTAFVPYLIKAIQELNQKVERFETT